jgi:hypothetical protein
MLELTRLNKLLDNAHVLGPTLKLLADVFRSVVTTNCKRLAMPQDYYEDALVLTQAHNYEGAVELLMDHTGPTSHDAWSTIAAALFMGTSVDKREEDAVKIWRCQSLEGDSH